MATEISTELATRGEALPVAAEPMGESMSTLLTLAIEQKVPVEMLERLMAMEERISERNARAAFFEALTAFRSECPPITKTQENTQFSVTRNGVNRSARFAPLEEIDRIARPVAAKHGLVWTWDTRVEGDLMHISCRLIHVMGHTETTNVSMPFESKAGASPQQKYSIAQSYGMRYSLIAALGITTAEDDVDGQAGKQPAEPITEAQAADLSSLVDEIGVNRAKFLVWLGVADLSDLPKSEYKRAVDALEAKRAA